MRVPERWLRAYCDPPVESVALEQVLTMGGLEVESAAPVAPPFDHVVLARIDSATAHPDADRLSVCQVDCGEETLRTVVCGAPNARAGLWSACALPGARLPGGLEIRESAMRGVTSRGMLCSARELGINDDHAGILEIDPPPGVRAGSDLRQVLALDERVLELKITPNLAHCMSVEGVARELAALTATAWRPTSWEPVPVSIDDRVPVRIEADDLCGRFSGRVIRDVDAGAPTPPWIRARLEAAGQRSISALVDLSNYVMLELGRPTHIFDLDRIAGGLTVRWARDGESIELLNGQTVALGPRDGLAVGVIADEHAVESLAGIMGGEGTAVTLETRNIYVEAAFWWPAAIAGRARLFNFSTDAAQRFERGTDFSTTADHVEYLSGLILGTCGGRAGPVGDEIRRLPRRDPVRLRIARARKVSGISLTADDCLEALARLELDPRRVDEDTIEVSPPARRFDLVFEEDLIEEVVRIHGFDRIDVRPPLAPARMSAVPEGRVEPLEFKRRWVERDYQEVIQYSFIDEAEDLDYGIGEPALRVLNPIASDLGVMRRSLWPRLVATLVQNVNRKADRVRLFEIGRAYLRVSGAPEADRELAGVRQPMRMAALVWGPAWEEQWGSPRRMADFFDLKGDLATVCRHRPLAFEAASHPALHPGRCARVLSPGIGPIGWIGVLHPRLAARDGIDGEVLLAEVDLDGLLVRDVASPSRVSRFPPAIRDLAVVVADAVEAGSMLAAVRDFCWQGPLTGTVRHVNLFDEYRGKGLENKEKSLAFRFWMQDTERTLADAEVEAAVRSIVEFLAARFGARLRS
jgi:phenylalanyl-tRNA synthetase beta chain